MANTSKQPELRISIDVAEGDRKAQGLTRPVQNWRFRITTGPRCGGVISQRKYKSVDSAYSAGLRLVERMGLTAYIKP